MTGPTNDSPNPAEFERGFWAAQAEKRLFGGVVAIKPSGELSTYLTSLDEKRARYGEYDAFQAGFGISSAVTGSIGIQLLSPKQRRERNEQVEKGLDALVVLSRIVKALRTPDWPEFGNAAMAASLGRSTKAALEIDPDDNIRALSNWLASQCPPEASLKQRDRKIGGSRISWREKEAARSLAPFFRLLTGENCVEELAGILHLVFGTGVAPKHVHDWLRG
ncbi:MAG: hypothetical protein ACE5FS_06495, partial [Paracoccaceae bacterium]